MHRNTYLLISTLAVIAALLIGVNIGRRFQPETTLAQPFPIPTLRVSPSPEATTSATKRYSNAFCKVAFDYPSNLTVLENASGSAAFTGPSADDGILLTCQKDIPRPAVAEERIEDVRIGSVAAKLYHTQPARDGAAIDTLIFRHPAAKLDVFLAATSEMLQNLLKTLQIF